MLNHIKRTPTYATGDELVEKFTDLDPLSSDERDELLLVAESYVDRYVGWGTKYKTGKQGQHTLFPREKDCCGTCRYADWDPNSGNLPDLDLLDSYLYVDSAQPNNGPRLLRDKYKAYLDEEFSFPYFRVSADGTIDSVSYVEDQWIINIGGEWQVRDSEPVGCECILPWEIKEATLTMAFIIKVEDDIINGSIGASTTTTTSAGTTACLDPGMSVRIGPMTIKKDSNSTSVSSADYFTQTRCCASVFGNGRSYVKQFLGVFEYGRRFMNLLDKFTNRTWGY